MNDLKIAEQCIPKECKDDLVSRRQVYCLKLASESDLEFGRALIDMPSAEPERKSGEWNYGEESGQDGWHCSECGFFVPWDYTFYGLDNIGFISDYHTCPSCDAKMLKYTGMRGEHDGLEK